MQKWCRVFIFWGNGFVNRQLLSTVIHRDAIKGSFVQNNYNVSRIVSSNDYTRIIAGWFVSMTAFVSEKE